VRKYAFCGFAPMNCISIILVKTIETHFTPTGTFEIRKKKLVYYLPARKSRLPIEKLILCLLRKPQIMVFSNFLPSPWEKLLKIRLPLGWGKTDFQQYLLSDGTQYINPVEQNPIDIFINPAG